MKKYDIFSGEYPFTEKLGIVLAPNDSTALAHAIKQMKGSKSSSSAMTNHPMVCPQDGINVVNELKEVDHAILC